MSKWGFCRAFLAKSVIAGSIATAMLCAAPAAFAQEDAALAPQTQPVATSESDVRADVRPTTELGVETPWYEAFTLSMNENTRPGFDLESTVDWESPGGRWGVRVGIQDGPDLRSDNSDLSAGAFINLGDRIRLGGQVRLVSPDDLTFRLTDNVVRQPEIKFESALRF
ncbi:NtrZ family periplasmic regulatory protein [uncultured Maricaulis sp.]|uniref:NtrZ family periplasmic regulatory protein n=1 Tax=uncultured Maricaulis sp. TaxID=174710 RepID=UPI0030D94960|tara:strand:- start:30979 stop:31482 length:504 start_codon:yes stop_codon:yes gene_type:complete